MLPAPAGAAAFGAAAAGAAALLGVLAVLGVLPVSSTVHSVSFRLTVFV